MSLYDNASLVMIPSGYKDDKLYSIKPTDGSGDFTFSRDGAGASPATRVNASGLIEKGRTNELLQSNTFDTTWTTFNANTPTGGQSGYDGSSDAWVLESTATGGQLIQIVSFSGVTTFSVYAKQNSVSQVQIRLATAAPQEAVFDLSTGAFVSSSGSIIDKTITDIGSGWYRVTITANATIGTQVNIYPFSGGASSAGNIYIQDAQLEQGLISTSYIETTTAPVSAGLLGDMPRLDYSGGATCPSLLLEPSRVNLMPYSEYFNAWGTKVGVTITDNAAVSPEGLQNAAEVTFGAGASDRLENGIGGITIGQEYSLSCWIRAQSGTESVSIGIGAGAALETFTATTTWQRFTTTKTADGTTEYPQIRANSCTLEVYGFQHESGSYPTSYIPTYGSASTRGADSCSKTGITSLIGQSEGTLFAEIDGYENTGSEGNRIIAIGDGTSSKRVMILDSNTNIRFLISNVGTQADYTSSISAEGRHKVAIGYANNDVAMYIDGIQVSTDSSASIPACSNIYVGTREDGGVTPLAGGIKQALLFKTRLTNAELAALTTL